jgi:exodeoxyribonuclease X
MRKYRAIIIDTETTGGEEPEPIEVAWKQPGIANPTFCMRFKPERAMYCAALAVHHILLSELDECAPATEAIGFVPDADYWIGHNIDYDWSTLGKPEVKRIDTCALCRSLFPEFDSYSLGALIYALNPDPAEARRMLKDAHTAEADILNTDWLLQVILKHPMLKDQRTYSALYALSEAARIPKRMPFGKHKDTPINELPYDYVQWLLRQEWLDPYLRIAINGGSTP